MPERILLVTGIGGDGSGSIDNLIHPLSNLGYEVIDVPLTVTRWWSGRSWRIRCENIISLARHYQPGDHVVAWSNGALITHLASKKHGLRFDKGIFFGAALGRKTKFAPGAFSRLVNVFNPGDKALLVASFLLGHAWGSMGRSGYVGPSDFVENRRDLHKSVTSLKHGHYFKKENLQSTVDTIVGILKEEEGHPS